MGSLPDGAMEPWTRGIGLRSPRRYRIATSSRAGFSHRQVWKLLDTEFEMNAEGRSPPFARKKRQPSAVASLFFSSNQVGLRSGTVLYPPAKDAPFFEERNRQKGGSGPTYSGPPRTLGRCAWVVGILVVYKVIENPQTHQYPPMVPYYDSCSE